jgi:hypothetical protein
LLYGNNQIEELLTGHKILQLIFQLFKAEPSLKRGRKKQKEANQIKKQ